MSRYEGPIVDAHHHFWEPGLGKQPWLRPDAHIPFRYGDYDPIKRTYLPPDLMLDAAGFNLVGTVTMETEWELDDSVGEMIYTQAIADKYGLPNAAVAHAQLADPDVAALLEQLAEFPLVQSVRNKPGQAPSPGLAASQPTLMMNGDWRRGYAALAKTSMHFDLQTAWWHMHEAEDLARSFPDQSLIINHCALPSDRSEEMLQAWEAEISRMAKYQNVYIKVSGIGLPDRPWTVAANRRIVEVIGDHFGAERMLFASNFPVDSLCASYKEIYNGFLEISKEWSESEQRAAFSETAIKLYRIDRSTLLSNGELLRS